MSEYPKSISVIIPVYNEVETISPVLDSLGCELARMPDVDSQIIVVDDGSIDCTATVVSGVRDILLIRHPVNRGYGASLKSGIREATGDIIVTMDGDGQHNPADIHKLISEMDSYAMSAGRRANSSGVPWVRRPGKWLLSQIMNYLCRTKIPDINCGFRALRREVITRYLHLCSDRYSFSMSSTLALLSEGYFVRFVEIVCRPRQGAVSQVHLFSGFDAFMTLVRLTIVFHPLRVFMPVSLIIGGLGIATLTYDLLWTYNISDASILLIISALFILLFGLLSDQIAHVRREIR